MTKIYKINFVCCVATNVMVRFIRVFVAGVNQTWSHYSLVRKDFKRKWSTIILQFHVKKVHQIMFYNFKCIWSLKYSLLNGLFTINYVKWFMIIFIVPEVIWKINVKLTDNTYIDKYNKLVKWVNKGIQVRLNQSAGIDYCTPRVDNNCRRQETDANDWLSLKPAAAGAGQGDKTTAADLRWRDKYWSVRSSTAVSSNKISSDWDYLLIWSLFTKLK